MEFSNSVTIGRPPEEVFDYLAHFENAPAWNYAITGTEKTSPGPVGVGTTYRQVRSIPSYAVEEFTVTRYEPDHDLEVTGTIGPFHGSLSYHLEPSGGAGTVLVNGAVLRAGSGFSGAASTLFAGRVRRAVAENLDALRKVLEGR